MCEVVSKEWRRNEEARGKFSERHVTVLSHPVAFTLPRNALNSILVIYCSETFSRCSDAPSNHFLMLWGSVGQQFRKGVEGELNHRMRAGDGTVGRLVVTVMAGLQPLLLEGPSKRARRLPRLVSGLGWPRD